MAYPNFNTCSVALLIALATASGVRAEVVPLRPVLLETDTGINIVYRSGETLIGQSTSAAPAGVGLMLPGSQFVPVVFRTHTQHDGVIVLGPTQAGELTLTFRLQQKTPSLIERTLEVKANSPTKCAFSFALDVTQDGEFETFSGSTQESTLYDTVRGTKHTETFPVVMQRGRGRVYGMMADSPGLWENRCQMLLDPPARRLAIMTGNGHEPRLEIIKPPEDAREIYQYQLDGWQSLSAGETRTYTTWVFASSALTHYDAQVAAHIAVANGKGWNKSILEAILRNPSLFLLRRNLALDVNQQPRDGKYIFISGPGYGWKQWVSDGFYVALGLDDPEKTIESNRAVFWHRVDYEDNSQYYLIWAAMMKRMGGIPNEPLVRKAYEFIRTHEVNGEYIPPPLPGASNPKAFKTYHDQLPYDDDDCPTSNQGFHCGALLAARELQLGVTDAEIERAIAAYQALFNSERGFMPTSRKQRDTLGQDTLYGATLTYAVFGKKLLTDEIVLTHVRTSEKVKSPYGLRVISTADGALLPGHSGVYTNGGSWFLNDAANYLLADVHGMPPAEVDSLLIERIGREIALAPAFNESISTVDGKPFGQIPYCWNAGYWWLRKEIRNRQGRTGLDPVEEAVNALLGVVREDGALRLEPERKPENRMPDCLLGYTQMQTNLPGGRFANVRTARAMIVKPDGSGLRMPAEQLVNEPNTWTQFAGWSPDGSKAIIAAGWENPDNAEWEEEHKQFRYDEGQWRMDSYLLDLHSGELTNITGVERVSHYNGGLFFNPNGRELGFTALINGVSKAFAMDLDGHNKRDLSGKDAGYTYGYSASPDGKRISYHEEYQIYLANADGSGKKHIETGNPFNFGPAWSPDGQWLMFVSGVRGKSDPYLIKQDGSGLRKLGELNGYQGWILFLDVFDFHEGSSDVPVWSKDSKSVFYTAKVGNNVEMFHVTLDGKSRQLTHTAEGSLHYHPVPSPDGRWLAYGGKRDGVRQLYIMRLADQREHRITDLKLGEAAMWCSWQPTGKK